MQNVSGIKKWNYEKLPLNFAMQFPFPVISGNNNVLFPFPKCGNGISIPVPKNWDGIFPFPFPKVGNEIFHSRSQSLGMGWAIPVPVPKWPEVIPAHPWGGWGEAILKNCLFFANIKILKEPSKCWPLRFKHCLTFCCCLNSSFWIECECDKFSNIFVEINFGK